MFPANGLIIQFVQFIMPWRPLTIVLVTRIFFIIKIKIIIELGLVINQLFGCNITIILIVLNCSL